MVSDLVALVIDSPAPIKQLSYPNPGLGIGNPVGARSNVDRNSPESDRVIISHRGLIAKGTDPIDIHSPKHRTPGPLRLLGGSAESLVVGLQKALQEEIGPLLIGVPARCNSAASRS